MKKIIFSMLFMLLRTSHADIFSSTSQLRNLMYLERHLINSMNQYVIGVEQGLTEIKKYINDFMQSAGQTQYQGTFSEHLIANPIQAYQMIKRLAIQYEKINEKMAKSDWKRVKHFVNDYQHLMPTKDDLNGAALSLIRLQDTYDLTYNDLIKGKILNVDTKVWMTARDCLFIAKQSFTSGYYGHALEWFDRALMQARREGNTTASVDEIIPFYNFAIKTHDELSAEYWKYQKDFDKSSPVPPKMRYLEGDNDDYRKFQILCRDQKVKTPKEESHLKCFLSNQNNAWLILQPIKVEVYHTKPYIAMFHDLLSDQESDMIRELAAPKLRRAKVRTEKTNDDEVSNTRTSQTAWFSPDQYDFVNKLNERISAVTGLSADMHAGHSELMQVANYGMGGHYSPHYDYLIVDRPEEERHLVPERDYQGGDRTATLMFYLSDVTKGGATVFPRLNVQLRPRKNSAAFWFNLYRNGNGIIETIHGACPVLIGEKWVSNHWIRDNGQIFKRKCSLDPDE